MGPSRQPPRVIRVTDHGVQFNCGAHPTPGLVWLVAPPFSGETEPAIKKQPNSTQISRVEIPPRALDLREKLAVVSI